MTTGDKVLLGVTLACGAINFALTTMLERGAFGSPPWPVLYALIGASGVGALICLILLAAADRSQFSWGVTLACTIGFGLLTLFNLSSFAAASAAV